MPFWSVIMVYPIFILDRISAASLKWPFLYQKECFKSENSLFLEFILFQFNQLACRGRNAGCPASPAQIRT